MTGTLPLTVLVHEGPQARAYLWMLRSAGIRVDRLLLMIRDRHPVTGKKLGRWLPRSIRSAYAQRVQEMASLYWPRKIRHQHPQLVSAIVEALDGRVENMKSAVETIVGPSAFEDVAEHTEAILVEGWKDPCLAQRLSRLETPILFTGGGIVPRTLLELPGLTWFHVHPGSLPEVRGADGLLWSSLTRGRPGFSCFAMEPGIDTGDLLAVADLDPLEFRVAGERPDDATLYRALFSFVDPVLRAEFLRANVLDGVTRSLEDVPRTEQDPSEGLTYHFMHDALKKKALEVLFPAG